MPLQREPWSAPPIDALFIFVVKTCLNILPVFEAAKHPGISEMYSPPTTDYRTDKPTPSVVVLHMMYVTFTDNVSSFLLSSIFVGTASPDEQIKPG